MGLNVKVPNAFTVNKLVIPGRIIIPFPFSVTTYKGSNGVYCLSQFPQNVIDLCDILECFERIVVFEVSSNNYDAKTLQAVSISQEAGSKQLEFQSIDPEIIVISGNDLYHLLENFSHYDFHAFDVRENSSEDEIINQVLMYYEHKLNKETQLLSLFTSSTFFLDSHDDCYLYFESYDLSIQKKVFERTLQIYTGTMLFEASNVEGEITELPKDLVETLFPLDSTLTILRDHTHIEEKRIKIGISLTEFSFREEREYPVSFYIQYDALNGAWDVLH